MFDFSTFAFQFYTMLGKNLEPDEYYISENGYIIFTEKYHLKRGYCCKNGCKHCPYGFDKKTDRVKNNPSPNQNKSSKKHL